MIVVIGAILFTIIGQWPIDRNEEEAQAPQTEVVQRTPVTTVRPTPAPAARATPAQTATPTPVRMVSPTAAPTPVPTPIPTSTPSPVPILTPLEELRLYALDLINRDRADHNLPPVALGSNPAAQFHAEDMLEHDYLGHWWADGRKPYMVYTQTGGAIYASENVASSGWTEREWQVENCDSFFVRCQTPSPLEEIKELQWGMMYDDADSDWGHRDNILGETHLAVNIGVASNGKRVTFVQHFEGGNVEADGPPTLTSDGTLSLSVSKPHGNVEIAPTVAIYFDPVPSPKTPEQIGTLHSYCVGGGFSTQCGDPAIRVIKPAAPGRYYSSLPSNTVIADEWVETDMSFRLTASVGGLVNKPGVYTVTVWRDSDTDRLTEVLLELSIIWSG